MDYTNSSTNLSMASTLQLPAVKRQKKSDGGYNSTSNSAQNTGAYNSDNDSGDELFANYVVPESPAGYQTQPTQIIDRSGHVASSPPETPRDIVQVPASSPFTGRDSQSAGPVASNRPTQNIPRPLGNNLAMSMAPAGTAYRPPPGIVSKAPPQVINVDDDEDDGPRFQGGSSDEDVLASANIKPTTFLSSANSSFGVSPTKDTSKQGSGNAIFTNIIQNAAYKPQLQTRPDRAQPVADTEINALSQSVINEHIQRIRQILPATSVLTIRNALIATKGSLDDSVALLCGESRPEPPLQKSAYWPAQKTGPISISDDEVESPKPKFAQPDMKRVVARPMQSINQKYASTQALLPKPVVSTTPPKPKRRLVNGRKHASSPPTHLVSSPLKPSAADDAADSYDSDSGVASVAEEDPRLEAQVLNHLNKCTIKELVELTNIKADIAELMINARPFKTLDAARCVENSKVLKSGKKSSRAPVGDRVVDAALEMFQGYKTVDNLVDECGAIGKPLAEEMTKWGFDVYGAQKEGELEMTSFEDNDSQRDSGIGSPASRSTSANGDDDVKTIARKRANVQFLKKPDSMAESCILKDYQIVGLNWLALMYRHKLSGILADEMGLGKTCQVISFLTHLKEQGNTGPHLVICPGTTLENWMREFQKFSPEMYVYAYHGPKAERPEMADFVLENRDQINVVITTYEMAAAKEDNKFMRKLRPDVSYSSH
jgi:SWI/SNF-related matrix-associated actin-dependent regulator 1 of chromatin subfamily A